MTRTSIENPTTLAERRAPSASASEAAADARRSVSLQRRRSTRKHFFAPVSLERDYGRIKNKNNIENRIEEFLKVNNKKKIVNRTRMKKTSTESSRNFARLNHEVWEKTDRKKTISLTMLPCNRAQSRIENCQNRAAYRPAAVLSTDHRTQSS